MKKFFYVKKILENPGIESEIAIVTPNLKDSLEQILGPLSDEEYEAKIINDSLPADVDPKNIVFIEDDELPNREFRNAWIADENKIIHDIEKVKNIQLDRLRAQRAVIMETNDVLRLQANDEILMAKISNKLISSGEDTKILSEAEDNLLKIITNQQALRDITEPLKALDTSSNDQKLIEIIKKIGVIPDNLDTRN